MKPVYFILPNASAQRAQPVARWLASLPELSLLAPIETVHVSWSDSVTGSRRDWIETMIAIKERWDEAEGFVVWAPEASLLQLSGTASLMFKLAGKPILFFAAEYPDLAKSKQTDLIGLKSTLINSVYIACADIGEVGVLIGQSLYRPSACGWGMQNGELVAVPSKSAFATIDFQLHLNGEYQRRTGQYQLTEQHDPSSQLAVISWHPGVNAIPPSGERGAALIEAESAFWSHPEVQTLRERLHASSMPVIWFSHTPWPAIDWEAEETGVTHEHAWWASLVAHFAFAQDREPPSSSLRAVERLILL